MLLSFLIFSPLVIACLLMVAPQSLIRKFSLLCSVLLFGASLTILKKFDPSTSALQLVENYTWVKDFGISYFVGVDGISIWLVLLSTFLLPILILGSWNAIEEKIRGFHINLFVLTSAMIGTFVSMDAILFYIFFEASLIPMYFIVGIWGGQRKLYATMKFFIYTMAGSVLMLIAIIGLMFMTKYASGAMSASVLEFYKLKIPFVANEFMNPQTLMFVAFSLAFAIKVPMFPLHTWLPDAHVEAPTPGSVVLAAVMLKMGTYGFLRFVIPLFPEATHYWGWVFLLLGVVGIIYGALVAMVQPDIKKLVAYSSVSHMGYVMMGLFALNSEGISGALYQMLNHGVSTGALFLLVGMIYERTHSREISKYGGLAPVMPIFTILFFIITLSSIAVPGTNGFIGEFLILFGVFMKSPIYGSLAALGVVLGACYMLWMFKKVFFGTAGELVPEVADDSHDHGHGHDHAVHSSKSSDHQHKHPLLDLSAREICVLAPLVVLVFWMGLVPNHFLRWSKASLEHLAQNYQNYELAVHTPIRSENSTTVARKE